jgi:uncharacterized protein (DUF2225 family)
LLTQRKEELETRRKKLQNIKRGVKKISGSGGDEEDLDIIAEAEAIRTHLDQLKK